MKALSVRQPWAWAILNGKPVENRNWLTNFRGLCAIHASLQFDHSGYRWLVQHRSLLTADLPAISKFKQGGIIGIADLVDCVDNHSSPFFFGRYGFVFKAAAAVNYVPCRGRLGFFDLPADVVKKIHTIGAES